MRGGVTAALLRPGRLKVVTKANVYGQPAVDPEVVLNEWLVQTGSTVVVDCGQSPERVGATDHEVGPRVPRILPAKTEVPPWIRKVFMMHSHDHNPRCNGVPSVCP